MTEDMEPQAQPDPVARAALAAEFGLRRIDEVVQPLRWIIRRQLFTVPVAGEVRFPGFQFAADGTPLPAIAAALAVVAGHVGVWDLALWFIRGDERLGGRRPVDVLTQPELVVEAARRLIDRAG